MLYPSKVDEIRRVINLVVNEDDYSFVIIQAPIGGIPLRGSFIYIIPAREVLFNFNSIDSLRKYIGGTRNSHEKGTKSIFHTR